MPRILIASIAAMGASMRVKKHNDVMADRFLGVALTGLATLIATLVVLAQGNVDGIRPAAGLLSTFLMR